jgi:hypothetical protein
VLEKKDGRIAALETELAAARAAAAAQKPRCLYEGYANARDYLEAVLELPKYWEMEEDFCANKTRYDALVTVRCEPSKFTGLPFRHVLLSKPIPPRADGRKIATASLERTYNCPIKEWFKLYETPYLRNCPLYEGDIFLERLREKHTDEELEDLFYSFQGWEKKTYTEAMAPPSPLEVAKAELEEAKERAAAAEKKLADAAARPEIRRQSAMQMVIAISMIARTCPDASFQEIHDMWAEHADKDAAEQARKDAADAGGAALRSWLGGWLAAGSPMDSCLCACLEPGCPTFNKVYKKGRGFVDRFVLEQDEETERQLKHSAACGCMTPEMCPSYQRGEEVDELDLKGGEVAPAPPAPAAGGVTVRPAAKKSWAQVAAAPKRC